MATDTAPGRLAPKHPTALHNSRMRADADSLLADELTHKLEPGYYGTVTVAFSIHDGTINHFKVGHERTCK